ncbi:hypothetical protein SISSUDRAFT_1063875 [Sistotremastrum suecicum HHB10207 ss-3]|uniref:Senescence domain-containing protein n=1 Tax=Sistotremastrum suecicum HHB10207 ss-3 TaxID=1314776 RepID=A0A166BCE8_9AGAM|nr:hypothetical protein SISSUDRAFT_1063875 [Sistotremastrum suecicum HHB10207 ss-3]
MSIQGFLLLTIPNCRLVTPQGVTETGVLSLECITIPVPPISDVYGKNPEANDRDVWLVLRLNSFELPIQPTQLILFSRSNLEYTFTNDDRDETPPVVLTLNRPTSPHENEDIETFEVLLSQYGVVHDLETDHVIDVPSESKQAVQLPQYSQGGQLVLVDENDGQIIGSLEGDFRIKETESVHEKGREKDPVVIDMPEEEGGDVYVRTASLEETDTLVWTAAQVSRGITYATDTLASGMNLAANFYVSHSTPTATPVVFSESTKRNVQRMHTISGQAVSVTKRTTEFIHSHIDRIVAGTLGGSGSSSQPPRPPSRPPSRSSGLSPPPPIPPRPDGNPYLSPALTPTHSGSGQGSPAPPPPPPPKPRLLNRLLLSTDMLLTTLENSATHLVEAGTNSLSTSLGHKYGPDVGNATHVFGASVKNAAIVYIDARGVGRRALLRRAGKQIVRGRLGKREVSFGPEVPQAGAAGPPARTPSPSGEIMLTDLRSKKND